jgi:type VI secretion system protein ImpA
MSLVNLEELLRPVADAAPSGENLEYSPEFLTLERVAQGKPEQRMGDAVVPAEPPDARVVLEQGLPLFARTKDLRVAVHVAVALISRGGLQGLHDGLALIRGLLEGFWPTLHPELDMEEGGDPTMRITALAALPSPAVLQSVRNLPLARAQGLGQVLLKEVEGGAGDAPTLEAVLRAADPSEILANGDWFSQALAHLAAVDATFEQHTGSRGPDLSALVRILRAGAQALAPRLEELRQAAEPVAAADGGAPGAAAGAPAARMAIGEISSREDVVKVLDKICAYYARYEPSSPLPLLIQRCKRLVPMSFVEIIGDLAPNAMGQVEAVVGKASE